MRMTMPVLATGLLLGACSAALPGYPVPPQLPAETIPLPPVSEAALIWQPGDWAYAGDTYRLQPGHYVPAEGHGHDWVFGHWTGSRPNYAWVPGGWTN